MFSLVYKSVLATNLSSESLNNMLQKARLFNREKSITGCLLHHKGEIIQLIEGDETEVKSLFKKIQKDKRHEKIIVLNTEENLFRMFGKWSMIYTNINANNTLTYQEKRELFNTIYHSSDVSCVPGISKLALWKEANLILSS